MTGLAIERNKGLLVPDTQKLLRTLIADIEDVNRVRKGGKRLGTVVQVVAEIDRFGCIAAGETVGAISCWGDANASTTKCADAPLNQFRSCAKLDC